VTVADRLLTAREVAGQLGFSAETVLRWWRAGEFEGVAVPMPGGAIRFREAKLEEWLEERATTERGSATHPASRRPPATLAVATHPDDREEV
jgi:excisionase family DNA binding protein